MLVPVVIVHIGDSSYLRDVVEMNAKKNPVVFIGCEKNAYLGSIPNVTHISYKTLQTEELETMKAHFYELEKGIDTTQLNTIHSDFACTNNGTYQFLCFARVYFLKRYMETSGCSLLLHADSDCVILESAEELATALGRQIAFPLEQIHDGIHMVGSIHNAFLTPTFCTAFLQLYDDIYRTGTKRHLLQTKVAAIQQGVRFGYICDMNLYYLLWQEKLVDFVDLNTPFSFRGEPCVFDHCLGNPTGFEGASTYTMIPGELGKQKRLVFTRSNVYAFTNKGLKVRLLSVHFNAQYKQLISQFRLLLHA